MRWVYLRPSAAVREIPDYHRGESVPQAQPLSNCYAALLPTQKPPFFIVAFRGCRHLPKRPCSGAVGEDWTLMRCQRGVSVRGLQVGPRITIRIRIRTVARHR